MVEIFDYEFDDLNEAGSRTADAGEDSRASLSKVLSLAFRKILELPLLHDCY